jgi:uncharacterized surface protein with fasciclin (FAS1) repeats
MRLRDDHTSREFEMVAKLSVALLALGLTLAPGLEAQRTTTRPADLVDTAIGAGQFTTLVKAVQAAGLVETLRGAGPFTILAPTDAAFAKLPAGTVERLLANPAQLRAVLLYHVVPGRVTAEQVVKLDNARTAQGASVSIRVSEGKVHVGAARVLATDVAASNGLIHVIDTVLLPPAS